MTTSYNGWPAATDPRAIFVKPFVIAGVTFGGGVRSGDVATVLGHVMSEFHHRVEPLKSPGCYGYDFRPDKNDPSKLSCHASATAVDANAPEHPNGIEASHNFTPTQITEIHKILAEIPELAEVVHWGGDWHFVNHLTPDPMHWEIHDHDTAKLARVAARITALTAAKESPDMTLLADLLAVVHKHGTTRIIAARALLRDAALHHKGVDLALINAARAALRKVTT